MSRGPGRVQRAILDAIQDGTWREARSMLPPGWKHSDESALSRAIRALARSGSIASAYIAGDRGERLAFGPPGTIPDGYVCALVRHDRTVVWSRWHTGLCKCGQLVGVWRLDDNGRFIGWEDIRSPGLPKCGSDDVIHASTLSPEDAGQLVADLAQTLGAP